MSKKLLIVCCLVGVLGVGTARAASIDIILNPSEPTCSAQVGSVAFLELDVVVVTSEALPNFQGAQFQIAGVPSTWSQENVIWAWDTSVTIGIGNPLFGGGTDGWQSRPGCALAWSTCQPRTASTMRIGRILLVGAPTGDNVTLRVMGVQISPKDPPCPILIKCDNPVFTMACVDGGTFVLNGSNKNCNIVAVKEETWSGVKKLFQ